MPRIVAERNDPNVQGRDIEMQSENLINEDQ